MLHNVLRGQGAALLAISGGVGYLRAAHPGSFLLIALTCGLSLIAHGCTALQHRHSAQVMAALGNLNALYGLLLLNGLVGIATMVVFLDLECLAAHGIVIAHRTGPSGHV